MLLSRRSLIRSGALTLVGGASSCVLASAVKLAPTVSQAIGPFYPVARPLDQDADLTMIRGRRDRARGQVINVVGRVLDPDGRPVPFAAIDLWQANAAGRYAHPGDGNPAPLDPGFQGSARLKADGNGFYRFRTVKPGPYPGRVPHLHLDISRQSRRVVTQMYFPAEAGNHDDVLLRRIPRGPLRDRLIARPVSPLKDDRNAAAFEWDVVLGTG